MDVASKLQEPIMALSARRPVYLISSNLRSAPDTRTVCCSVSSEHAVYTCSTRARRTQEGTLHMASAALPHGRSVALGEYPALLAILSHCLLSDDDATR